MRLIERVSRTIILIVGVMVVTGTLLVLNTYANRIVPAWLLEKL